MYVSAYVSDDRDDRWGRWVHRTVTLPSSPHSTITIAVAVWRTKSSAGGYVKSPSSVQSENDSGFGRTSRFARGLDVEFRVVSLFGTVSDTTGGADRGRLVSGRPRRKTTTYARDRRDLRCRTDTVRRCLRV